MHRLRIALVSMLALAACLASAEISRRILDGYRVWRAGLVKNPDSTDLTWSNNRTADALFKSIPLDIEADRSWFDDRPPAPAAPPRSWLDDRRESNGPDANYIWNITRTGDLSFRTFLEKQRGRLDEVFTFKAPGHSTVPMFRLYPGSRTGFGVSNQFGWRAGTIEPEKPAQVIRIGVLGDSTTNEYPALLEHWLNRWSAERRMGVRFEVINAARPGTGATDAAGIMEFELAPTDPDYVLLYGFGNGIWFGEGLIQLPPAVHRGLPYTWTATAEPGITTRLTNSLVAVLEPPSRWSAAAAFLRDRVAGRHGDEAQPEPAKPPTELMFPSTIDESAPDPETIAALPNREGLMALETYLQALNRMDAIARSRNIRLCVSTFRILAFQGMRAGGNLYRTLNEDYWWPYSYAQIHRMVAFYNRTLRAWTRQHGHIVVDVDGTMPWLPQLYGDGMHELPAGEALHAWIVLQELLPRIRADLAAHTVPTPGRHTNWATSSYWTIERASVAKLLGEQ